MKARGKREARRPWLRKTQASRPEGPKYYHEYFARLRAETLLIIVSPGATRSLRFALAPGFHISAPLALQTDLYLKPMISARV
jgi:hypothetical protein